MKLKTWFNLLDCFDLVAREEAKKLQISPTTTLKTAVPESPVATPDTPEKSMTVAAAAQNVLRMQNVKDRLDSVLVRFERYETELQNFLHYSSLGLVVVSSHKTVE